MATKKVKPLDIRDGHPRLVLVMTPAPTPLEPGRRIVTSYRVNFDDPFTEADIIAAAVQGMVGMLTAGAIQLGMGAGRAAAATDEDGGANREGGSDAYAAAE